jgi:SAM-dependent methyltransferase
MPKSSPICQQVWAWLLRAVSVDHVEQPPEALAPSFDFLESRFMLHLRHAAPFFQRFATHVSLSGRTVLEAGSGLGPICFLAAQLGAQDVVGVDIVPAFVEYAREKLLRDYPHLAERVRFLCTNGDLAEVAGRRFDIVMSHDAFEHYSDPELMVSTFRSLLTDDGRLLIGFGPLWKSPYGAHIDFLTKMPWAHLIFPEDVVMAERRRVLPKENTQRYEDARGGLNRMTLARFEEIMNQSGLRCVYCERNVSGRPMMRIMRLLSAIRPLREYFTHNVYSVWALPTTDA